MNEHRGSADEGLWMVLCVLLLLLLAGAGGFVWLRQQEARRAMEAEQLAREAAEMNLRHAQVAMEHAEVSRVRAEVAQAEAARAQSSVENETSAVTQPLVPALYLNQDLWRYVESLVDAAPDAKVFTVDAASGELRFGDGEHGAAPPDGPATIQATYDTAGGGTVTVSLPETDLRQTRLRGLWTSDGTLRLEVDDHVE